MRIKKKHSRIIAFGIVFLCILFAIFLSTKSSVSFTAPKLGLTRNADGSIDASVIFGEFKKSEVKDGKKLWEITAKVGTYHPQAAYADLEQVQVELLKGEDVITMTSDRARVTFVGSELQAIDARGNVIIGSKLRDTKIYSETLQYEKSTDRVHTDTAVRVVSSRMDLKGIGLEGNTNLKSFSLLAAVDTTVQPKDPEHKGVSLPKIKKKNDTK